MKTTYIVERNISNDGIEMDVEVEISLQEKLDEYIDDGLIMMQKHPTADLFIYNYTPKVQYEKLWDEITTQCRGLILDGKGNIVAHPFAKFFNYEEHMEMENFEFPTCNFHIQNKMDGSLGILYWIDGQPFIATRGSFTSEQSVKATEILMSRYADVCENLNDQCTYLFEIIYPENRIVVNYDQTELVHLATIETATGKELFPEYVGFPFVDTWGSESSWKELGRVHNQVNETPYDNKEGVVITFENGFKCKMKHPEYVRLHRIMTNMSPKVIWESLRDGVDLEEVIKDTPDEFYKEVTQVIEQLVDLFNDLKDNYEWKFGVISRTFGDDRKEFARRANLMKHPAILFAMLDEKNVNPIIWKIIKP
jgi:RNA ligase